jgi:cytochrome oxidase Cu insertion factor (SCO1/SenC/PrrC family)
MKHSILILLLSFISFGSYAQADSKKILETLAAFTDQYGNKFSNTNIKDSLVIIYISGLEDPLTMAYDKLTGKKLKNADKVQFVGGFDNMHGDAAGKMAHLKQGFISKYGNEYIKVLLDTEGKIGQQVAVTGLAVIIIKKGSNKAIVTDYGTKRKQFFDAINQYFN